MGNKKRTISKKWLLLLISGLAILGIGIFLNHGEGALKGAASGNDLYTGETGTQSVNGVNIFYETLGEGTPVILLHGNGGSHEDLFMEMEQLAEAGYRVYAPDSRGQGKSSAAKEYHYHDMADDVYELIRAWGLEKPALYGWSDGGIIGLLTEIRHPGTLGLLAVSGANISPEGLEDSFLMPIRFISGNNGSLTDMIVNEPDISTQELASIQIPVLVTAGERDIIKQEHTEMIAESIPNAELMILEGEDHGSYIAGSPKMGEILLDFLRRNGM
ncbi:MAG: alpha/beta hydrolase [Blautia sp.]|nr:alpha/beta hydrolase [Blautia sp.]